MPTVLVAPDSFKGSLPAADVARAIADGWASVRPDDLLLLLPLADGGEGTLDALLGAVPLATRRATTVRGPDDRPVRAPWLLLPDGSAAVELASSSGLALLAEPRPLDAHTIGLGEVIAAALDAGARGLTVALGGSASTDGGAGLLSALGARFTDAAGRPVAPGNRGLADVAHVDLTGLRPLPPGGVELLVDVTSPLLGPLGAAAVFGPQKGADPATVRALEAGLTRLADLLPADPATPGTGAAGGAAFGLTAWGASIRPGAEAIGELVGLRAAIDRADVVVTGEGRFDEQSLAGKVVGHVLGLARSAETPVALVAGGVAPGSPLPFAAVLTLEDLAGSRAAAMTESDRHLRAAGAALAALAALRT